MSVFGADLAAPTADHEWRWAGPALGAPGTVSSLVPRRFERYVGLACDVDLTDRRDPSRGGGIGLDRAVVETLVPRLVAETRTPSRAYVAIWEGHPWEQVQVIGSKAGPRRRWARGEPHEDPLAPAKEALATELAALPILEARGRRYVVLSGPVGAVTEMHEPIALWARLVPDLWWPADRAWFVGSDGEVPWVFVGGSAPLADWVLATWPDRARPVVPDDSPP